jgi:hypothetical protein
MWELGTGHGCPGGDDNPQLSGWGMSVASSRLHGGGAPLHGHETSAQQGAALAQRQPGQHVLSAPHGTSALKNQSRSGEMSFRIVHPETEQLARYQQQLAIQCLQRPLPP